MRPIEFPEANIVLGKAQPQYQPLPAHLGQPPDIPITSCWQLEPAELAALVANGGVLWIQQLTFGRGFSPQLPLVKKPDLG